MSSSPTGKDADGSKGSGEGKIAGLPLRAWIALIIALYSLLFIAMNWQATQIDFVFFKAEAPLTVALALTFVGGGVTGALLMRRRARH